MRSSSEIAAEIRALKAQMADGMPYGNSAAHNAAVFDHVYSGDHSGIDQYNRAVEQAIQNKLQREATAKQNDLQRAAMLEIAKMNKAEAKAEQAKRDEFHKAVRAAQAREQYAKNLSAYNEALTNAEKQQYKLANEALEKEFGSETFGQTMADYEVAKAKDEQAIANLNYELEMDKREAEEKARKSAEVKHWIQENIIPVGAIKAEKKKSAEAVRGEIADFIRKSKGLSETDRQDLLDKLFGNKTQSQLNADALSGAVASGVGKDYEKAKKEREDGIALAKKAKLKLASGRLLLKAEQDALDKWGSEVK